MVFFCIFEVAVGIFWPSMMKMRATYVPDELRATIINLFRIPLNLFVCLVLANVSPLVQPASGRDGAEGQGTAAEGGGNGAAWRVTCMGCTVVGWLVL